MISIIILNFNGLRYLKDCLNSLRNQTFKDFEIILVDNGSKDGSIKFISLNYPEVKVIQIEYNSGFSKGNNVGIRVAKGEYIILLNNDTIVEEEFTENLFKAMDSDLSLGFCASKMLNDYNRDKIDTAGDGFSICGAAYKRGHNENSLKYSGNEFVFGACAGAAIYRKEMFDEIGLLDEDFFLLYEDADLSFRAQLAGYKCKYAANAIVYHKVRSSIGNMSDLHVYYGQRNVEYAYFKNMPDGLIGKTIFRHLAYNFIGFIYFTLKGKGLIFLKAKFDFLKDIKKVLLKRKEVQKLKRVDDSYIWGLLEKKWFSTRVKR